MCVWVPQCNGATHKRQVLLQIHYNCTGYSCESWCKNTEWNLTTPARKLRTVLDPTSWHPNCYQISSISPGSSTYGLLFVSLFSRSFVSPLFFRCKRTIHQDLTWALWSIVNESITDIFQELYERWRKCVVAHGDYFDGYFCIILYFHSTRL